MGGWDVEVRRYVVSGRVQGVGYRAFAARAAQSLKLRGGAVNRDDGRVEIVVEGAGHALERLESALREGPRFSRVDSVEVDSLAELSPESHDFDVEF